MQAALPPQASLILANNQELSEQLQEQGWHLIGACSQYLYTAKEPLPVKYKNIRQLTLDDLEYVNKHYRYEEREYLARRIWAGLMFGAYDGDRLVGFIGVHGEGSGGMLYVDREYRRQGIAESLEAYLLNRCIERGWIPYGHVMEGNEASELLQEKMGLYKASKKLYWLDRQQ
ncbi:MAG: GNAT family N-acetyltransferase [Acetatifactor sp.]|nr:GNAT family N-acetyltransferase [Acetatifactor sp.]